MTSKAPPVPPDQRSEKGVAQPQDVEAAPVKGSGQTDNPDKRGQTANTKINTTHQGYQQDR